MTDGEVVDRIGYIKRRLEALDDSCGQPTTEGIAALERFETRAKVRLPDEYRAFLWSIRRLPTIIPFYGMVPPSHFHSSRNGSGKMTPKSISWQRRTGRWRRGRNGMPGNMGSFGSVPMAAHCIPRDRKSTRLNSSHLGISYAVFCLKKKKKKDAVQDNIKKRKNTLKTETKI